MSEHLRELKPSSGAAGGVAMAGILMLLATFALSRRADALPSYAQQTGLACGQCHVSPAGGGPRTALGNTFAANGHKLRSAGKAANPAAPGGGKSATTSPAMVTVPPPPLSYPAVTANPGSYYSSAVNPSFGHVPELSYSNSVDTRIDPFGNR